MAEMMMAMETNRTIRSRYISHSEVESDGDVTGTEWTIDDNVDVTND